MYASGASDVKVLGVGAFFVVLLFVLLSVDIKYKYLGFFLFNAFLENFDVFCDIYDSQ